MAKKNSKKSKLFLLHLFWGTINKIKPITVKTAEHIIHPQSRLSLQKSDSVKQHEFRGYH